MQRIATFLLVSLIASPAMAVVEGQAEAAASPEYVGIPISLDLHEAPVVDVLRLFHEISGLNFVVHPAVEQRIITIDVDNVPWDQVLDLILETHGLEKELEGNVLRIQPRGHWDLEAEAAPPERVAVEARLYRGRRNGGGGVRSDVLPTGGPLVLIDREWAGSIRTQEQTLKRIFGLHDVEMLGDRKIHVQPGIPESFTLSLEDDTGEGSFYEITITAWVGTEGESKVRLRSEIEYNRVPFYEGEVVATSEKPFMFAGQDEESGDYVFLSLTPCLTCATEIAFSGKVARVGTDIEVLEKTHNVNPIYPEEAKKARIEGLVVMDILVDVIGQVEEIEVLDATDESFAQAARNAVAQWRYEPAEIDGKRTPARMVVKIDFTLE